MSVPWLKLRLQRWGHQQVDKQEDTRSLMCSMVYM